VNLVGFQVRRNTDISKYLSQKKPQISKIRIKELVEFQLFVCLNPENEKDSGISAKQCSPQQAKRNRIYLTSLAIVSNLGQQNPHSKTLMSTQFNCE
jgi:hypothetical protein